MQEDAQFSPCDSEFVAPEQFVRSSDDAYEGWSSGCDASNELAIVRHSPFLCRETDHVKMLWEYEVGKNVFRGPQHELSPFLPGEQRDVHPRSESHAGFYVFLLLPMFYVIERVISVCFGTTRGAREAV